MGEVRDDNLNYFDGDIEQDIATAIDYNRSARKHPYFPIIDVITVKNKLSHELVDPMLSNLMRELKEMEHPATVITVCICRGSVSQEKCLLKLKCIITILMMEWRN
ncbi:hypothetical protein [Pectobacterium versatile]|uniref:hypothetical protein n=1 Tax=Pectobacterium versatile TaxID=2488639 RepID=UPI001CD0D52E|nr:hypothetical protein [Pectobacterium versatile]